MDKQKYELNKPKKRLRRDVGKAVADFGMIEDGDKIMVCISGGKDSLTMLDILRNLQTHAPINFELVAVNLDQKQPGFPEEVLPNYFEKIGVDYEILEEDTYSLVTEMVPEGKTYCGWCSRFRREYFIQACPGQRLYQSGSRSSSRRHRRDFVPEHVPRRQDENHAAEAVER